MNIAGTWSITQSIDGQTFPAQFADDGGVTVVVSGGLSFFGAWTQSGTTVAFALTPSAGGSLTVYQGSFDGPNLLGILCGTPSDTTHAAKGTWTAAPLE